VARVARWRGGAVARRCIEIYRIGTDQNRLELASNSFAFRAETLTLAGAN
jgi:hypothetical protein